MDFRAAGSPRDGIIDPGPEGGKHGGRTVAHGTPEAGPAARAPTPADSGAMYWSVTAGEDGIL
jgi:hypothetical protein